MSDIGHSDVSEEEEKVKALGLLTKIKEMGFVVSIIFIKNLMYKTKIICDTLQAEEFDVSGAIEEMKIAYSSLNGIRNLNENPD